MKKFPYNKPFIQRTPRITRKSVAQKVRYAELSLIFLHPFALTVPFENNRVTPYICGVRYMEGSLYGARFQKMKGSLFRSLRDFRLMKR